VLDAEGAGSDEGDAHVLDARRLTSTVSR
jgi:hypothetical protein